MLNRRLALLLLLAAAGCKEKGADSASPVDSEPEEDRGPDPWEDLEPVALDPFRALVKTPLERATRPSRLLPLGPRPLTAVMDADEGALHVLDHRYHQAGAPSCVDLSFFPDSEVGDRQGGCGQDQVEINRGRLEAGALLAAAAADSEGMRFYAVGRNGLLYSANADVLEGDPFDYLRMDGGVALEDLGGITEGRAVFGDGALWLAHDLSLSRYSPDGALLERYELPGEARSISFIDGAPWVVTEAGIRTGGGEVWEIDGARVVSLGGELWVNAPEDDALLRLDGAGAVAETVTVEGALGALVADEGTGKLYLATTTGVAVIRGGAEVARYDVGIAADIAVTASHEIQVLSDEGEVSVFLDEEALVGPEPLDFVLVTFFEKPRSPDEDLGCREPDQSVQANVARANLNRPLIEDLPAPAALAVTPHAVSRILECGEAEAFEDFWDRDFFEHGYLFHEEFPDCGEDYDCHRDHLEREMDTVAPLGMNLTWVTGLSPHLDDGLDWARALVDLGAPTRHLFFGLSILPEIPHHTDPRSKEAFPLDFADASRAWRIDSAAEILPGEPDGAISIYPGDSVAAFTQSGCPNQYIQECRLIGGGGGQTLGEEDTVVLEAQLFRALAARADGEVNTFSFHLPDLGAFDFVEGCEESGRIWSGEECQGEALQSWMFELHQRYVLNGLMRWSRPSELPEP